LLNIRTYIPPYFTYSVRTTQQKNFLKFRQIANLQLLCSETLQNPNRRKFNGSFFSSWYHLPIKQQCYRTLKTKYKNGFDKPWDLQQ
jgi:hypothetical protein